MRLTVCLLGVEVLSISTDPPPPPSEGDGVEITRHSGQFEIGFRPAVPWSPVEHYDDGP